MTTVPLAARKLAGLVPWSPSSPPEQHDAIRGRLAPQPAADNPG